MAGNIENYRLKNVKYLIGRIHATRFEGDSVYRQRTATTLRYFWDLLPVVAPCLLCKQPSKVDYLCIDHYLIEKGKLKKGEGMNEGFTLGL